METILISFLIGIAISLCISIYLCITHTGIELIDKVITYYDPSSQS